MVNRRYITLLLLLFTVMVSCGQQQIVVSQNPNITSENIVDEIVKNTKHFPQEPVYLLDYENYYSHFAVLLNDIPVFKQFSKPLTGSAFDINQTIFKSGTQKISFKMYPVGKTEAGDVYNTFPEIAYLKFILVKYLTATANTDEELAEYKTRSTRVPNKDNPYDTINKFEGSGKTYYEDSFSINVEVPYKLDAKFLQAQDLRKMEPKLLEAKLLKEYEKIKEIYQNKDLDNIARLAYDKLLFEFVSTYEKPEVVKKVWEDAVKNISDKSFEMQPIENYKMEFFADGRLVALMSKSQDKVLRGEPALWAKYKDEDGLQAYTMKHYFYIPQGETEFKVY